MPRMLDICSGLGGASQAFIDAGWEVIRLENNPMLTDPESKYYVSETTHCDILETAYIGETGFFDFIWASPPCTDFSDAISSPSSLARNNNLPFTPDTRIALKVKEMIQHYDPKYWCVENVRGSRKEFSKIFGPPWQIIMPFFLYGKFPRVHEIKHTKKAVDVSSNHPLRANIHGKIPYQLSENFLHAIETQTTLEDWMR
jgi:hypothetical protein